MIKVKVDTSGVSKALLGFATRGLALDEVLARAGGVLRANAKRKMDAQQFVALDPATIARKITAAEIDFLAKSKSGQSVATSVPRMAAKVARALLSASTAKSSKASDRAMNRAWVGATSLQGIVNSKMGQGIGATSIDRLLAIAAKEARRKKIYSESLKAARAHKATTRKSGISGGTGSDAADRYLVDREKERVKITRIGAKRYRADKRSMQILGSLRDSMAIAVKGNTAIVFSHSKWSSVHNDGGTAGHGAAIPQREFLVITESAAREIVTFLEAELAEKWAAASAGT